jgi:FAD/FMN-containing dehydrogenase
VAVDRRQFLGLGLGGAFGLAVPFDLLAAPTLSKQAARALRSAVRGPVLFPRSPGYNGARLVYNTRYDGARPDAVVQPLDTRDVQAIVGWANRFGIRVVPRSGGHSYAGYSTTSNGVVFDLSRMRGIRVANGQAVVGAGAQLIDVYATLSSRGLLVPAGSCPSVGIAGLALGGGLGILGRRHGLTCDRLRAAQVVLADGRVVDCDEDHDEDLFWALRGAGLGTFGVVTSLTFETVPAPPTTVFELSWRFGEAARVVEAWQSWAPGALEELAASLLITAGGDEPTVSVFGALSGGERGAKALLDGVTAEVAVEPDEESYDHLPYHEAKRRLAERGPADDEGRLYSKSEFFRDRLPAETVDALVRALDEERGPFESRELDFTPWGGAYNRPAPDASAFPHRDARFLLKLSGPPEWLSRAYDAARPHSTGGAYVNFPDPDLPDWETAYYGANYGRLQDVKARYDPDGVFTFPQAISAPARHPR